MAPKVRRAKAGATGQSRPELEEYRRKRDFGRTAEPEGSATVAGAGKLRFVVQRHDARRHHFDLRLELDGVMKSWAVPKGPSLDPGTRRLAVQVEDHPMEYNSFEGTIPEGEYGGGTVMLWDVGTYSVPETSETDAATEAVRRGLREGKLSVVFHGERLHGGYTLVRTRGSDAEKPQWLLIKQEDGFASADRDLVAEATTSVRTGRTMEEIAAGKGGRRVWRAGGEDASGNAKRTGGLGTRQARDTPGFSPMLATPASDVPAEDGWTFEPKWDGIRILAFGTPDGAALITRNGNDKRRQFPEVAEAVRHLARREGRPVVLDGEIVGVQAGEIVRFEALQPRMHAEQTSEIQRSSREAPAALVAFDLLLDGDDVLAPRPWTERRRRLEALLGSEPIESLRLGETGTDREPLLRRARAEGWEGLIAKRVDAPYTPGVRSRSWLKLKLENRQEFVVGGWTEPRNSRQHIGALLLGYYDEEGELRYAGSVGTGFSNSELTALSKRLKPLQRKTPPFADDPEPNQRPHWTTPRIVVEVRFNEWTRKGLLRQPVYVGIRDDKPAREVTREPRSSRQPTEPAESPGSGKREEPADGRPAERPGATSRRGKGRERADPPAAVAELEKIEKNGGAGLLRLGGQARLEVTSLEKKFFPGIRKTKGDLLRYYARMAEHILPFMEDRPLVLKRFPDGEAGKSFYQQNAPKKVPDGVRVEIIQDEDGKEQRRFVGGNLATLLHTVQLGAISYDPWHSRVGSLDFADYTILDLDPGPGASFHTVVRVALAVKDELDRAEMHGALKTSGSRGLHVYLPLPPRTPLDSATLVAQIIATRVASQYPEIATVERMTRNRPHGTVYVDYLQNILGKTVAGVYAVRARPTATTSTPLHWSELSENLDPGRFTLQTLPDRVAEQGEIWGPAMARPNALSGLLPGA